jgi:hypothetical protein
LLTEFISFTISICYAIHFNSALNISKTNLPEAAHYGAKRTRTNVALSRHTILLCGGNLAYLVFACLLQKPNVLN